MPTTTSTPRIRSLLRQAGRAAEVGKRRAAEDLYRQILEEAPDTPEAWLGLAEVVNDPADQKAAYERVVDLDPYNETALKALDLPVPERVVAPEPEEVIDDHDHQTEVEEEEIRYVCYRHPDRETSLRCYNCDRPICTEDANLTPVGYLCPICHREKEDVFFSAGKLNYISGALVALILGLIGGYIALFLGFWTIFLAAAAGALIGRLAFRASGRNRGRYLPHVVAAMVVIGALIPAFPLILSVLFGPASLFQLLGPGIYLFLAPSTAFWQVK
jgi:tetratricopeptide (TPR) repeat protein